MRRIITFLFLSLASLFFSWDIVLAGDCEDVYKGTCKTLCQSSQYAPGFGMLGCSFYQKCCMSGDMYCAIQGGKCAATCDPESTKAEYNDACKAADSGKPICCTKGTSSLPTLKSSKTTVVKGESTTLTWTAHMQVKKCVASGDWSGDKQGSPGGTESITFNEEKSYTFTIECFTSSNVSFGKATVTVPFYKDTNDYTNDYGNLQTGADEGFGGWLFTGPIVPCGRQGSSGEGSGECTICHMLVLVNNIFKFVRSLVILAALLFLTIGGVLYIISAGQSNMKSMAKNVLTKTITGFAIFLLAHLIVFTVLKLIAANNGMIGKGGDFFSFSCSTESIFGTGSGGGGGGSGGGPGGDNGEKCCVKQTTKTHPDYGKPENCSTARTVSKADCEKWCDNNGGDVAACKANCKDNMKTCDEGTQTDGACAAQEACGAKPGEKGNCAGYSTNVSNQCDLVSEELNKMLGCMKSKGSPGTVTSITAQNVGNNLEKSKACCGNSSCTHATYTCHYGCGTSTPGYSYAVDIGTGGWSESELCKVADASAACGGGKIWGPRNISCGGGGKINYWADHDTHLHVSTKSCNH